MENVIISECSQDIQGQCLTYAIMPMAGRHLQSISVFHLKNMQKGLQLSTFIFA